MRRACRRAARRRAPGSVPKPWRRGRRSTAARDATLRYFAPVATTPGFPRALARTLEELRLTGIAPATVERSPLRRPRPAAICSSGSSEAFAGAGTRRSRALLFTPRRSLVRAQPLRGRPSCCSTSPIEHAAGVGARRRVRRWCRRRAGDGARAATRRRPRLCAPWRVPQSTAVHEPPERSRQPSPVFLFDARRSRRPRALDGSLEFFSAPGEGRECVEIARRILGHARRGVALRRDGDPRALAAQLLRPARTRTATRAACRHGSIVAPAGRILPVAPSWPCSRVPPNSCRQRGLPSTCRSDRCLLGARRRRDADAGSRRAWIPSQDEAIRPAASESADDEFARRSARSRRSRSMPAEPVLVGTLRTPWRWEQLLGDAAVIGRTPDRWRRRLDGHAARAGSGRRRKPVAPGRSRESARAGDRAERAAAAASARVRPAGHRRDSPAGRLTRPGANGSSASNGWRRACFARRRTCCACLPICVRWPTSVRSISTKRAACWPRAC